MSHPGQVHTGSGSHPGEAVHKLTYIFTPKGNLAWLIFLLRFLPSQRSVFIYTHHMKFQLIGDQFLLQYINKFKGRQGGGGIYLCTWPLYIPVLDVCMCNIFLFSFNLYNTASLFGWSPPAERSQSD